jgi:hypothetical protein
MGDPGESSAAGQRPKGVYCYLVTIKCVNHCYIPRNEIEGIYTTMRQRLPSSTQLGDVTAWELDKLKRWHYHFMMSSNREPYYRRFRRKNYTIHFQPFPLKDWPNIIRYLQKVDQHPAHLQQLDVESYGYYHDLFIEDSCAESK